MSRLPAAVLCLLLAPFANPQEPKEPMPPGGMPKPGPQHQELARSVGTWDAVLEMVGPDGKAVQSKGVSVQKLGPGGFWLVDDFKAEFMGMPYEGHGVTGYDPGKKKFVGTWADNMSPYLLSLEGSYDPKTKALTMTGEAMGMEGKLEPMKTVSTWKDADTYVFEMFMVGKDGTEVKSLTITYKRRKA